MKKTKVFVVAWEYESGGGFDWYYTKEKADKAFDVEKKDCISLKRFGWKIYRFAFETTTTKAEQITDEIDSQLIELCDQCKGNDVFKA